ncbi:MAG: hypothetical protein ACOZF0_09075 [Thermodesulfobacteriota bacterium]
MKLLRISGRIVWFTVLLIAVGGASAETKPPLRNGGKPDPDLAYRIRHLEMLMRSIDRAAEDVQAMQRRMKEGDGVGREHEFRKQIQELSDKQAGLEDDFRRLAADVDEIKVEDVRAEKKFDWQKEIVQLITPLLREVNKITERPRQIEELRDKIASHGVELARIEMALNNVARLIPAAQNEALEARLKEYLRFWQGREEEIRTRMDIDRRELARYLGQEKTVSESVWDFFRLFFKSRGRNLICAFLVLFLIWFGLYFFYKPIRKYSPFHHPERSVYTRVFDATYFTAATVLAVAGCLTTLYFFHDWVLLSIAVLFLLGIAWASKQAIPHVLDQLRMMLNLGPVREGEVLVYRGLLFEVRALNLYSLLENRALQGGLVRVPIRELIDHRSRPQLDDEPWFPSQTGDWVHLSDGGYGQVVVQTPETVMIRQPGGEAVFYRTGDYLAFRPVNLSRGFRLWIAFSLGYETISGVNKDIPRVFEKELPSMLAERGYGAQAFQGVAVVFRRAGRSSLDLLIMADFTGAAACDYKVLPSTITGMCLDICNRHQWRPPFHQVRIHGREPE